MNVQVLENQTYVSVVSGESFEENCVRISFEEFTLYVHPREFSEVSKIFLSDEELKGTFLDSGQMTGQCILCDSFAGDKSRMLTDREGLKHICSDCAGEIGQQLEDIPTEEVVVEMI